MTLSIGDGANDVAMIQEANIGCGLFGLEGSQAAMSADYAFGQFRFLTKLLLVHGRWSYQRVADMHSNFFYKVRTEFFDWMRDQRAYFCRMLSGRLPCFGSYPSTSEYDISCMWVGQLTYFILSARGSFDATYLYQYTFILLYNLVFTSLPVIVLGGMSCYSSRSLPNIHYSSI